MHPSPDSQASLAAVLLPGERSRVEAAVGARFRVLHRDSVPEALRVVRERRVEALLLSVHRCSGQEVHAVGRLLRAFPEMPALAVVSHADESVAPTLLSLGASGVRQVVDLTRPNGWSRLRDLVSQPGSRTAARILGPLFERLPALPPDTRAFLETTVRLAPTTPTVRGLARAFGFQPSTLTSRFTRAGLPSAKRLLAAIRLLHAAAQFENQGLSITDVAYRLDFSSPQSFGRHVRVGLGITSSEFRRRFPFPVALERFFSVLIDPYRDTWRRFRPLGAVAAADGRARRGSG